MNIYVASGRDYPETTPIRKVYRLKLPPPQKIVKSANLLWMLCLKYH